MREYGNMLMNNDPLVMSYASENEGEETHSLRFQGNATPFDYLEKIFQLPFQLNPLSESAKEIYIGKLLESDLKLSKAGAASQSFETSLQKSEDQGKSKPIKNQPGQKKGKKPTAAPANISNASGSGGGIATTTDTRHRDDVQKLEKIFLSESEIEFIQGMHPILADTPRTIKRFVNVCRLIKSHADWGKAGDDLHEDISNYEAMIFILALVTGIPMYTRFIFDEIEYLSDHETFQVLIDKAEKDILQIKEDAKNLKEGNGEGVAILHRLPHLEPKELLEEWECFKQILERENTERGKFTLNEPTQKRIQGFMEMDIKTIKPLFRSAVRFSFRFTEY